MKVQRNPVQRTGQDSYLNPRSTNAGGLNTSDSTSRLVLESYQKAQINNDGATNVGQAHYGEVLRIRMKHKQAKGAIAFQEDYLGAGYPRTVAWLVAHGEANDSTPQNPVWHNHFSVELPDENGALQTSFEFPFGTFDVPNAFGVPLAEMYNRSTTKLIAANQGLHVENAAGVAKNIFFSSGTRGLDANKRWSLQADSTSESGSNVGTDFRINRYSDAGAFVATPLYIQRSTGFVGVATTSANSTFHANGSFATALTSKTASYVAASTDHTILVNATSGTATITLPTAVSKTGRQYIVKKTDSSGNAVTVATTSSQTIDGSTTFSLSLQNKFVQVISDGANWQVIGVN